jgi:hypothetical protein
MEMSNEQSATPIPTWPFWALGAILCVSIVWFVFTPEGENLLELLGLTQPQTAAQIIAQQQKVRLCQKAAVCKQYDAARLECATAANFNMCLNIKLGGEFDPTCVPGFEPSLGTPNRIECLFRTGRF